MPHTFKRELYEKYRNCCTAPATDALMSPEAFEKTLFARLSKTEKCVVDDNEGEKKGVLHYTVWEEDGRQICCVPSFGCDAADEKTLVKLFSELSEKLVAKRTTEFQIHLYAGDTEAQRLFSLMQFGYIAQTGIRKITDVKTAVFPGVTFRTLDKNEIGTRWQEIWALTGELIGHLQKAPVFYPGTEFTEEVYRDFFLSGETFLHAAFDKNGKIIGMIETNTEPCGLLRADVRSADVGEIYVVPAWRGSGLSDKLFSYAERFEQSRGTQYLWVGHGTANPQARGFWDKYFTPVEVEMTRRIETFDRGVSAE